MSSRPTDILFEPVRIGPVTAPNRFYQVPHCTGLGHRHPQAEAALRACKAEGGWGVVCTQEVEIHPSSEISPYLEGRLWDDADIPAHRLTTDAIHQHGSLAGIELVHNGQHAANLYSRVPPMGPTHRPVDGYHPVQARAMSGRDIREFRRWHVEAARRSMRAGYDIVYVYAGHDMATLMHFLLPRYNDRSDDYGGSLKNRTRLLSETLTDVRDAVGGQCAIALRLAVDELLGDGGLQAHEEASEIVGSLADIPDLWDVNISDWSNDSATARFEPDEGYQEPYVSFVKTLVSKPVVGVGRFTSATAMVSQVTRGILDFIGAARPSIADPFLPDKIRRGDHDAIRECIGCNICVSSDNVVAPIRCTQNPTMGEEWKRGWHPERIAITSSAEDVLVVGAGPAGLECAAQLLKQGHRVMLAEAADDVGGRLLMESRLPGLSSYRRVRDHRHQQIVTAPGCELLLNNRLTGDDVLDSGMERVFVATGATWSRVARGRAHPQGVAWPSDGPRIITPDDSLTSIQSGDRVVVFDDDHYYLGGVLAESLARRGCDVTLVTPANAVSQWTEHTLEQHRIQSGLLALGVTILCAHSLADASPGRIVFSSVYSKQLTEKACDAVLMVTSREPDLTLFNTLHDASQAGGGDAPVELVAIGDCHAPGTVAAAVYSGHLAARCMDDKAEHDRLFRRELIAID